jgi:hypothetical protein
VILVTTGSLLKMFRVADSVDPPDALHDVGGTKAQAGPAVERHRGNLQ